MNVEPQIVTKREDPKKYDRDVHFYDRQIEYKLNVPKIPQEDKIKVFEVLSKFVSKEAHDMISVLIQEQHRNFDVVNGYDGSDLLYFLLSNGKGEDLIKNLDEQLADAFRLGQCPQGRVIRMLNLINAFVKI